MKKADKIKTEYCLNHIFEFQTKVDDDDGGKILLYMCKYCGEVKEVHFPSRW